MDWTAILIVICIGFVMCWIPTIMMFFTRYNSYYTRIYCVDDHYEGEKILKVWQLILIIIGSIIPIVGIILGICLIANILTNFGLGVYQWDKSTKLYKFLSQKI